MASKSMSVRKLLVNLRDNSKPLLQCGALTYLCCHAQELEKTSALAEEEYSEICRILIELVTSLHKATREEALRTLHAVVKFFKDHNLRFFESALKISRNKRQHIFQFLDSVEDNSLAIIAQDPTLLNFLHTCLHTVETNTMQWLLPTSCTDNLQILAQAENRNLSEDEELEEFMVSCALVLLQRLYKIAFTNSEHQKAYRFSSLVMDKVVTLAYMGHKRQRNPAIKVLFQAIRTDLGMHVKTKFPDAWTRYKNDLQGPYSTRMALLVKACELDWANQWSISIQLLGTDLHRGAMLINNLLSVEERAFKSTDTTVRRQAFVSWQLLIDNFALDMKELATARRIKLLCVPLTAKNSKSELIALTKLEVWWYLITKLYPHILKFADPVITQFLNFCFGPLGDTPLLSAKVDVIASPGKRFYKTRIVAVDALLQLIVQRQEDRKAFPSGLEGRLPHPVAEELFKDCYKAFLHSIGEAIIIINQMHDNEITNREEIMRVLLTNLMRYVRSMPTESKPAAYNELILVITELLNRSLEVSCVHEFVRDEIIPELSTIAADLVYRDRTLMDLITKVMIPTVLKDVQKKHIDAIGCLLRQAVKPKTHTQFHPETLKFLYATIQKLELVVTDDDGFRVCFELWFTYAEIGYKYILALQDINEGTATIPNFKTIEAIIRFPFAYMYWANSIEAQRIALHWKDLYKQFEAQADVIATVKPNQIVESTAVTIDDCLTKNDRCYRTAVYCLNALLSTINYKFLLAQNDIPSIVRLVGKLTTLTLHESRIAEAECALKALSSLLITVYGHSPKKALSYMKETSPTIELMLKTDADDNIVKEIISTWETIVSILRGLNTLLDANFLRSYKDTISLALKHPNSEIVNQALSILEMKDNVTEEAKLILVELSQVIKKTRGKDSIKIRSDKIINSAKHVKIAGSFLNRISSPKPSKPKEKEEKRLTPLPPEPDSQDYVVIKSAVKVDVSRLTEHQKESLKRRRDDIPALYNDLSQSCSQDTQDLQKWFEGKAKRMEVSSVSTDDKNEKQNVAIVDKDLNKENTMEKTVGNIREENNIEEITNKKSAVTKEPQEKSTTRVSTPETLGSSGQDTANVFENIVEPMQTIASLSSPNDKRQTTPEESIPCSILSPLSDHSYVGIIKPSDDLPSNGDSSEPIAKKLNFESRDEYPDENDKETEEHSGSKSTPSSKGNRTRRSSKISTPDAEETGAVQNAPRTRTRNSVKQNSAEPESKNANAESQDSLVHGKRRGVGRPQGSRTNANSNAMERGTKRKAASDSESEGSERDKRRRKNSRSPSITSGDSETAAAPLDKRTETELSRLRINMVCSGPLPPRRRSKINEDSVNSDSQSKRRESPESKGNRTKSGENPRRSHRGHEKEENSNIDTAKKRRRKSKLDTESQEKEEEFQLKPIKSSLRNKSRKSLQDSGAASESQIIVDDEETHEDPVASNIEHEKSVDSENKDNENSTKEQIPDITENPISEAMEIENDLDEVVESSQDSSAFVGSNKKSIVKLTKLNIINSTDEQIELPRASSPLISMENLEKSEASDKNSMIDDKSTHDDSDETFLDISAIRPQLAEDVPTDDTEQQKAPEESKTNASAASTKALEPTFNLSSPKNPSKRYVKPKGFAPQGRAAHMLGLVTKLAVLEKDGQADKSQEEEISTVKKNKNRDSENETPISKRDRSTILKDSERMGSPGGSRQEKIFNNMKAADYAASPPSSLFGNLKNDGEKVSPKMDKLALDSANKNNDASSGNDHDGNGSSATERDELPILEWSSANPPSLTASPSASILKRCRPSTSEMETDVSTPNKGQRKRVSFADPPVSKEMGYEITTGTSPLKTSKFNMSRGLIGRKDSPIRLMKQFRPSRMIAIDTEKSGKDEEPIPLNSNDLDMECERENELLMKIAEDLEDTAESRMQETAEISVNIAIKTPTISSGMEISKDMETKENITPEIKIQKIGKSNSIPETVTIESQTQDDLFNSSDEKFDSPKRSDNGESVEKLSTSTQNSSTDSFKLNVTNDSVIGSITNSSQEEENKSDCLEDTVDVKNLTSLNFTENSIARTTFEVNNSVAQMADTLPVTDSLLGTQDSQGSSMTVKIAQPELLNSTNSIYPSLIDCHEPIDTIIDSLTNPLWVKNLSKYFATRSLRTIGDLARLSEREVVRIPVKGNSKLDFVVKVLGRFEQKLRTKSSSTMKDAKAADYLALSPDKDTTMDIAEVLDIEDALKETQKSPGNSSLDTTVAISQIYPIQMDSMSVDDLDPRLRNALTRTSTVNSISAMTMEPSLCSLQVEPTLSQTSTIILTPDPVNIPGKVSVATSTNSLSKPLTKSVGSQTTLEELLDEVDVKLVLQSAVKRSSAETLLAQYKQKMGHMSEAELGTETIRMLSMDGKTTEATLKAACRAYGLNKILARLPEIFYTDKQFYTKVFTAYCKKFRLKDCLEAFNLEEVKNEVRKKCSVNDIAEMLSKVLKEEPQQEIEPKITELSNLDALLKRIPMDVVINHTVANEELIPSSVVLDIALRNNSVDAVTDAIESKCPAISDKIFEKKMTHEAVISHIEGNSTTTDKLLSLHRAVCDKLSPEDLLNAYRDAMERKLKESSKNV